MKKIIFLIFVLAIQVHAFGEQEEFEREYYSNGKLKYEVPIVYGKRNGIFKGYFESGALLAEVNLKNGEREGMQRSYLENGELCLKVTYKEGKLISGEKSNGRKLTNAEINNYDKGLPVSCD